MKPLAGVHHVALSVSDRDASAAWYSGVLGLVELFREDAPERRAAVFRFPGGGYSVGLVEHIATAAATFDPAVTGLDHLAFTVDSQEDLRGCAQQLTRAGVEHSGPIEIPPGEILNFRDPDGIALSMFWDRPG
jgi:glyoxylase I family protein